MSTGIRTVYSRLIKWTIFKNLQVFWDAWWVPYLLHLGLTLGAKSIAMQIWSGVIERWEKRIAIWKGQYLSLSGRIILVKIVFWIPFRLMLCLFFLYLARLEKELTRSEGISYGKATTKEKHSTWLAGIFLSNREKMVAFASGT